MKEQEYEHINIFRGLYSELAGKQGDADAELYLLDPEISAYFRAYIESAVFPSRGSAAKALEGIADAVDIFKLALQVEKDSILYYQELRSHSPYPEAAELIEKVIVEERKHFKLIHDKLRELTG